MNPIRESREVHRVYAPPRLALREGEAPGAFGRGFFRRLWDVRGVGCFLLFFIGIGASIFLFGVAGTVGPYRDSLRENGDPRFFYGAMTFGTVFILVAARMLQVVLTSSENTGRRREKRRGGKEPWTTDHPWKPEGMEPDYNRETGGSVLGRVAFFALIGLFNIAWASPSLFLKGLVLVFDLFALLILYDSVRQLVQAARRVRPRMRWMTFPAFVGGRLEGRLLVQPALQARGPVRATLRCVEDRGVSGSQGTSFEPFALYEQVQEIPPDGEKLSELPLAFEVPPDLPGTNLGRQRASYWQVLLEIPLAGPDFEVVFLAPVYAPPAAP